MADGTPAGELELRVSDRERDAVATRLADERAAGRLTLDELSQRADLAYTAKTKGDLEALVRDLPATPSDEGTRRPRRLVLSLLGGSRQTGRWRIEGRTRAIAILGGCELDLRHAEIPGSEVVLTCVAVLGGISITVPEGVEVDLSGFTIVGGRDLSLAETRRRPGTPLVRVRAFGLLGGVSVSSSRVRGP